MLISKFAHSCRRKFAAALLFSLSSSGQNSRNKFREQKQVILIDWECKLICLFPKSIHNYVRRGKTTEKGEGHGSLTQFYREI